MRVARFPNHRLHVCQHETLTTFRYQSVEGITEMGAALLVANALPPSMGLFLGNSMPIRDVDALAGVRPGGQFLKGSRHTTTNVNFGPGAPVCANRGASGIDGVVSAAAGFAAGTQLPVTLVIGDVSFQHDANGLLLLRERPGQPPVTIVVVRVLRLSRIMHSHTVLPKLVTVVHTSRYTRTARAHYLRGLSARSYGSLHTAQSRLFYRSW